MLKNLSKKVINNEAITFAEAESLLKHNTQQEILELGAEANKIRQYFCGDKVDLCGILNAKSGACSQDCIFCAQSARYSTQINSYPLFSKNEIEKAAVSVEKVGANSFCLVTSGGELNNEDFFNVCETISFLKNKMSLNINCSLGFLNEVKAQKLKTAGISEYNHNLETSQSFYPKICSTHSFADRVAAVKLIKDAGIKACCGGIIGMGESEIQRLELAFSLREVGSDCVTINILNPRPGTPLENQKPLLPLDIIKTIAIFRFILPQSIIKVAGGREVNLRDLQSLALISGTNGLIIGNYLTTTGRPAQEDIQMIKDLGMVPGRFN
jgi:biotin synthase